MPKNITFHYFHGRGIGEPIRLLLTLGEIVFTDRRYTIEEFAGMTEFKARLPFGQMPALELDGAFIGQTDSISRYAARLANLYPADAWSAARCDMIVVAQAEIQSAIAKQIYDGVPGAPGTTLFPPEEKARRINEWYRDGLPIILQRLENLAGDGTMVDGSLSWADIAIFCRLNHLIDTHGNWRPDAFPKLQAVYAAVEAHPRIQDWMSAHPEYYPHLNP